MRNLLMLIAGLALLASCSFAHAGSVEAKWNASATTGQNAATGYALYHGTVKGGPYAIRTDVGNTLAATVPNLTGGLTYCFIVKAYNAAGESTPSNEACALIPFPPADAPPASAAGLNASGKP